MSIRVVGVVGAGVMGTGGGVGPRANRASGYSGGCRG